MLKLLCKQYKYTMNNISVLENHFSLSNAQINKLYQIVGLKGEFKIRRRLLDFGFVNTDIKVLQKSSLKGVCLVELRNYVIALRESEVANIIVKDVWWKILLR